ncbi:MAG TPA: FAD-dependent oxidoreductase, partial [Rhodospirillaceae bacterium]|nr:FAD-dependent oxidoreductase [Rhodospirillaceae bacterium]
MERCDIIVIGAGVLGLAIARALSLVGREVIVIDKANAIGTETSSRHSEIIHAGIYYPKNSLKAKLCLKGKRAIYKYCEDRGVEFKKLGKIVVATKKEQISELEDIKKNAELNGVMDLSWLTAAEVNSLEPSVSCVKALWSPSTGILDSHAFMLALLGDAENLGATLALLTPVTGGEVLSSGIRIDCGGDDPMSLRANGVINCGGLWSQNIAKKIIGLDKKHIPETYYCKGNYYILSGKSPFTRPIYPVPEKGGLGVHVTVDMAGQG